MHTAPTWRAFASATSNTLAVTRTDHAKFGSAIAQLAESAQLAGFAYTALFARTPFALTLFAAVTLSAEMVFFALFTPWACAAFNAIALS